MNIAELITEAIAKHNAILEVIEGKTLRIHNSESLPSDFLDLIRTYKPYLLNHMNQQTVKELAYTIQQHGANLQVIEGQTIRLHQPELIPDHLKAKLKTHKSDLISYLNPSPQQRQQAGLLTSHTEHEIIRVYFARLERHRNNLRKINKPIANALIKPRDFIQDIIYKFGIAYEQAQKYIECLVKQQVFSYDCNLRLYILPNYDHSSMLPFKDYQLP